MRHEIRRRIEENRLRNEDKKRIVKKINPYDVLKDKFKSAAECQMLTVDKDESQQNRRRREKAISEYVKSQQKKGEEKLILTDKSDVKIKLPFRLEQAFEQIRAENEFDDSDFGRLMRNNN